LKLLARYLKPEIHVSRQSQLREGPATLEGVIERADPPMMTPFRSTRCAAYSYTAACVVKTRGGMSQQILKKATVYSPFFVTIEGGTVRAVPAKSDPPVTADDHRTMQSQGLEGFFVLEDAISAGRRVHLRGMLEQTGDGWQITFRELVPGQLPSAEAGAARTGRKKRK
jgi:hypothetical protein